MLDTLDRACIRPAEVRLTARLAQPQLKGAVVVVHPAWHKITARNAGDVVLLFNDLVKLPYPLLQPTRPCPILAL